MKKILILLAVVLLSSCFVQSAKSQTRIGVYDSRMIAVWYYNSSDYRNSLKSLYEEMKTAKEAKNESKIKELEALGELYQRIAHDKTFGKGSTAEILESKSEIFKQLAEQNKLSTILSKWELNYNDPSFELVDITLSLMDKLGADEKIKNYYKDMKANPPIKDAMLLDPRK